MGERCWSIEVVCKTEECRPPAFQRLKRRAVLFLSAGAAMSIKVMTAVWEHAPFKGGKLLILLALADFANERGICWPSIPTLAKKARLTGRQAFAIIAELERKKAITIDHGTGPHGCNTYRVNFLQGVKSASDPLKFSTPTPEVGFTQTVIEPSLEKPSSSNGAPIISEEDWLEKRYERSGKGALR